MKYSFFTVNKEYQFQIKEKGSTFIAFLFPIKSEEQFKRRLNELKNEYHDAVHHCYAFKLDKDGHLARSSDDGEPSGTAGKPIMNQLLSAHLSYAALVVVRYFGGIKLGTGGLIKAYKEVAKGVIDLAEIIEEKEKAFYFIESPFELSGEILRIINKYQVEIIRKTASENLVFHVSVPLEFLETFKSSIIEIHGLKLKHEPIH